MAKLISLIIDEKPVSVPEGTLVVDAAKKIGIDIPVFCYHPKMEPVGMCRMCLVDIGRPAIDRATRQPIFNEDGTPQIQFGPKLETACTTPVSEGMVVVGMGEKVASARREIIEFILTSHPLDCPICDKGGECPLQNLTMEHGAGLSRFLFDEKMHLAKSYPLGDLIFLDRERCIQCARCVRFQDEIVDDPVIGFENRGRALQIVTYSDPGFDSYFSGNTTDICPVGALTTSDFRFNARPWELKPIASICSQCPVGCNITYNVRREARSGGELVIKRVMPRQNEEVNEIWICDKGRFAGYHYAESPERLSTPLVRREGELVEASWDEALEQVASRFKEAKGSLVTLVGGRLPNEDLFNLKQLTQGLAGKALLDTFMAGGDLVTQMGVGAGTNFAELGSGDAILVVASDLEEEAPIWWLRVKEAARRGATVIVANPRPTKTDRCATHILRFPYGSEAATLLALIGALNSKKTRLPDWLAQHKPTPAQAQAAKAVVEAKNLVVLYGQEGMDLKGSQELVQACANLLFLTDHLGRPQNGLIGVWPHANTQGAWELGFQPSADLQTDLASAQALYIAASDPVGDDPTLASAVEQAGFVVVQELFLTDTARLADVVLPVSAQTEREGTYTSGERRVQRFFPAVPGQGDVRADYVIASQIAEELGIKLERRAASMVFSQIAAQVSDFAGLSYRKLAETHEQWPIVGRGDLYYGGTTYENTQGLGVQLQPASQRRKIFQVNWIEPASDAPPRGDGLWAVPVTTLYDQGTTLLPATILHTHIQQPQVRVNSATAKQLEAQDGYRVAVELAGTTREATLVVSEDIPAGIVCVPRSLGIPIRGPQPVVLRVAVTEAA
jgi:NADH-quinone oxidoreductase subunit G